MPGEERLCRCGCGNSTQTRSQWLPNHRQIVLPVRAEAAEDICACGCEQPVSRHGNRFLAGHNTRGARWALRPNTEILFWEKVNKFGPINPLYADLEQCWIWIGMRGPRGYGHFRFRGRIQRAHRFVLYLLGIEIPKGKEVMHLCNDERCVRPSHLAIGTHEENMRYMWQTGQRSGEWSEEAKEKVSKSLRARFKEHPRRPLTPEQRERVAAANRARGKPLSEEHKNKIRESIRSTLASKRERKKEQENASI